MSSARRDSWIKPVISAEHGATISLAVCFFLGVWLTGRWNTNTTLAFFVAFATFELQTPLTRLIRRRQMKTRLVIWTAIYGLVAATGAGILWMRIPVLSRIYAVALGVLLINLWGVYQKDQKSIPNELAVFAGLSLALPFVYTATNGHMIRELLGLWLLCALVLSSPIFTVRIRLSGDEAVAGAMVYYISGLAILLLLVQVDLLPSTVAWTFLIPVVKLVVILLWLDRYRRLKITSIGFVELGLAIAFAVWVGLVFV